MADIHQPLHTLTVLHPLPNYTPPLDAKGQPTDVGGNGFTLNGTPAKLHAYWDDIFDLGQPTGSDTDARARTIAEKQLEYAGYRLGKLLNGVYETQ